MNITQNTLGRLRQRNNSEKTYKATVIILSEAFLLSKNQEEKLLRLLEQVTRTELESRSVESQDREVDTPTKLATVESRHQRALIICREHS